MHASVIDFAQRVWSSATINHAMSRDDISGAIYNIYTPPPPTHIPQAWMQVDFHPAPLTSIRWRIYISATPEHLMAVWQTLVPLFGAQAGVVAAKHTTPAAAGFRVDTIVIYLLNESARDLFIGALRPLFLPRPPPHPGAPVIPPRLRPSFFKADIPPTTAQVPGLVGVSHAQQPVEDGWAEQENPIPAIQSFGGQLSDMLADAYLASHDLPSFLRAIEHRFLEQGMNVNQPWQLLLSQDVRDQLTTAGNAARRARGKI